MSKAPTEMCYIGVKQMPKQEVKKGRARVRTKAAVSMKRKKKDRTGEKEGNRDKQHSPMTLKQQVPLGRLSV